MMPRFTLTNKAKDDLLNIGRFTQSRWGRDQRLKYLKMLDTCVQQLADDPLIGKDCQEIRPGYRRHLAGRHLIFYRQLPSGIEIIRILHESMDVASRITRS